MIMMIENLIDQQECRSGGSSVGRFGSKSKEKTDGPFETDVQF